MKPRLLDLFCGAGLASIGYTEAGFEVVGVDIRPQPNYPYRFMQADALDVLCDTSVLRGFDAIHASPPCQAYSVATKFHRNQGGKYPDLLPPTRCGLLESGRPFVIENVPGAPLRPDVVLRGDQFGLHTLKKRWFELGGWWLMSPRMLTPPKGTMADGDFISIFGSASYRKWGRMPHGWRPKFDRGNPRETWHFALGLPTWFRPSAKEMAEGIPPAYTKHIGGHLLEFLGRSIRATAVPAGSGAEKTRP